MEIKWKQVKLSMLILFIHFQIKKILILHDNLGFHNLDKICILVLEALLCWNTKLQQKKFYH